MQHDTMISPIELLRELVQSAPKKHALRIERLLNWLSAQQISYLDRTVFLSFGKTIGTHGVLVDLAHTLRLHLDDNATLIRELSAAVRDHRRRCHGVRMISEITSAPWWKPFLRHCDVNKMGAVELTKIDDWLSWMHHRKITSPTVNDFLDFASRWDSAEGLESLRRHLKKMGAIALPATEVRLSEAIVRKRATYVHRNGPRRPRRKWPRCKSVPVYDLPKSWRDLLTYLKQEALLDGKPKDREGTLPSTEKALRALCWVCRQAEIDDQMSAETVKLYELTLRERGCRASTREIQVSLLLRFMKKAETPENDIAMISSLHRQLIAETKKEVPLKFGRLAKIGGTKQILQKAVDLLAIAEKEKSFFFRSKQLSGAAALALFTLLPLRVSDTQLRWGRNISFENGQYRIFVKISKSEAPYSSHLCEFLTPFLNALLLQGCDERYLEMMRNEAIAEERHVFAHADGRAVSPQRVKNLWTRHVGCSVHIARTLVHTELGKLGSEGIAEALALCAHRHPSTARFYQGKAMADALLLKSTAALLEGFSDAEIAEHFPDLDGFR